MLVVVNPTAHGGKALEMWRALRPQVREIVGPFDAFEARDPRVVRRRIADRLQAGEREFVAAGGDGTVNWVATRLFEEALSARLDSVTLGAIGLGSSNDFHKPLPRVRRIGDVPCRLDFHSVLRHDFGRLTYEDPAGVRHTRWWLLNASVGTTAEANRFYNQADPLWRWFKRRSASGAMVYAAAHGILGYRALAMTLRLDDEPPLRVRVRNLGVVKNPHFTGVLRYDTPYEPDSGRFHVHLLEEVPLARLAATLAGLARGRFTGQPGTHSWRACDLAVEADEPFAVETDGEVVVARRAWFSLIPGALRLCT